MNVQKHIMLSGDQVDDYIPGTWHKQVELCTITGCSLYPYRPVVTKPRVKKCPKLAAKAAVLDELPAFNKPA